MTISHLVQEVQEVMIFESRLGIKVKGDFAFKDGVSIGCIQLVADVQVVLDDTSKGQTISHRLGFMLVLA